MPLFKLVAPFDKGRLIMMRQANGMMDVRLMRTLLTLLTECSVSKTADILGQAQPTVSLTLKRLREMLDDPLLVVSMRPTCRAMMILSASLRTGPSMRSSAIGRIRRSTCGCPPC
ncbi:helix-turn-helix domain-containing protein [Rhizobium leguminosarum]|uniref:helix-turn-helix domain-containing protein n=1 Tax=Rhizobium leguminosarum TaxID=384 RepID=UPI0035127E53